MTSTNTNTLRLSLLDAKDKTQTYDFAPGTVMYQEKNDGKSADVLAFTMGGKVYGFKLEDHDPHMAATIIRNARNALAGGAVGAVGGQVGIIVGMIAGYNFEQIKAWFSPHVNDEGYYCGGSFVYYGPINLTFKNR